MLDFWPSLVAHMRFTGLTGLHSRLRMPDAVEGAVEEGYVQNILSVMVTAGFYDDSGEWLFNVGLPGKSGVGGGIVVVVPGRFAIAVYSPPLDSSGNSIRGVKVMEELSKRWNLHLLAPQAAESR